MKIYHLSEGVEDISHLSKRDFKDENIILIPVFYATAISAW